MQVAQVDVIRIKYIMRLRLAAKKYRSLQRQHLNKTTKRSCLLPILPENSYVPIYWRLFR